MFYVQNWLIVIGIIMLLLWWFRPRRYDGIRKHSLRHRDYKIHYVKDRSRFDYYLRSTNRHLPSVSDEIDIVLCSKEQGKTVGAFIYMNDELLRRNKQLIKNGVVKRDSNARQKYSAPYMDLVKDKVVNNGGVNCSLYHLTHLIAFRHSLSEGDFDGLLFAGTAHLNSGARYDLDYEPAKNRTSDSTASRVNYLKDYFFKHNFEIVLDYPTVKTMRNFGSRGGAQFSLNEFEILLDFFVNWKKGHVIKYGVECYYENNSKLVTDVNVIMIDVTEGKLLVDVMLKNKL